jgi:hypothetical protein
MENVDGCAYSLQHNTTHKTKVGCIVGVEVESDRYVVDDGILFQNDVEQPHRF